MKVLSLVILSILVSSCLGSKSNGTDSSKYDSSRLPDCSFDASFVYSMGVDVSKDFIVEDISSSATIQNSSCPDFPNGPILTGPNSWITRATDILTMAGGNSENTIVLQDYEISGNSFELASWSYCVNGYAFSESLTASELRSSDNSMRVSTHVSIADTGCSTTYGLLSGQYTQNDLYGTWKSSCSVTGYGSELYWYSYYHNSLVIMKRIFSNGTCTGTPDMYIEWNGPYVIRDTIAGNVKEVNYSFQNFYIKLYSTTLKNTFNTNSICGNSSWFTGSDISVKGEICDLNSIGVTTSETFPSDFLELYDLFEINGMTLNFGDTATGDRTNLGNRPTAIDTDVDFIKDPTFFVKPTWIL